ncbi:hypothetical protein [uncultured Sphingomonas sp.]|uniref:hypothetical protein n=1 Tax=uncultured Sphingomonas sp. TaxID=158754 RepID=UPI0025F93D9F|nr:hypothetical protein [uncultured Sphingomonas sp.]
MVSDVLSFIVALGGVGIAVLMVMRAKYMPPLARQAIIGAAFGMFVASRYLEIDRSYAGMLFGVGVFFVLSTVAARHFQAYPPAS